MLACAFFGHRKIKETEELKLKVYRAVEKLVLERNVDTFLFGSKSQFDDLCYNEVSKIKEKYPHIKRIYVRAEYPVIDKKYESYLLKSYERTYYPEKIKKCGVAVYIKRNYEMIDKSQYCIVHFNEFEKPTDRKSGTEIALNYAVKKGKEIIKL